MKRQLTLIPVIKVHPSKIITYSEIHWSPNPPIRKINDTHGSHLYSVEVDGKMVLKRISDKFLNSSRQGNGVMSKQAVKRLSLAIEYLLMINKPQNGKSGNTGRHYNEKITFITLTLPSKQIHTDNQIKAQCLNQFLIEISKNHKVSNYVWRAEYQKNGNIHFHILVNKYIYWNDIRNRWNRIINKLGYVDRYRKEMEVYHKNGFNVRHDLLKEWPLDKQKQAYLKGLKTDWHNPNSIDVHSIQNITNIKAYLIKYLTKSEQIKSPEETLNPNLKPQIGRSWGASVVISNIKGASTYIDNQISDNLKVIEELFPDHVFKSQYFTVIDISIEMIEELHLQKLTGLFYGYLYEQFHYSRQLTI